MLTPLDHALAGVLVLFFPLRAAFFGLRRLRRADALARPRLRRRMYLTAMVLQWALVLALGVLWAGTGRRWDALGLVLHPGSGFLAMAVVVAAAATVLVGQQLRVRRDDAALARVLERVRHVEAMLPHTPRELALFAALSVTAGVCEELLYRGFLFRYALDWLPPAGALVSSSAVFGLGHLYQGWRGALATAAVGALLALVYVVSGSLFLGMVAHAVLDLHSGRLAQTALARARARAEAEARAQATALDAAHGAPPGSPA